MNKQEHHSYSALDIERYQKGGMTTGEMNAIEKAALDDPFLADALEGYGSINLNVSTELAQIDQQLTKRLEKKENKKVVSTGYPWWRVAALVLIIAGAALFTYQYLLKQKSNEVSAIQSADTVNVNKQVADSPEKMKPGPAKINRDTSEQLLQVKKAGTTSERNYRLDSTSATKLSYPASSSAKKKETETPESKQENVVASEAATDHVQKQAANSRNDITLKAPVRESSSNELDRNRKKQVAANNTEDKKSDTISAPADSSAAPSMNASNVFRGQVTDNNNTPLPFANVTNTSDNVGTYSDVNGYFVLISADTSLQVRVRSAGYESADLKLKNNVTNNEIVLQPDTKDVASIVISNRKINVARRHEDTIYVEEPEPSDGWYNYGMYLANNIEIPGEIKSKKPFNEEVELSFGIDNNGEPMAIKVEKSVCNACDAEAIRLLKTGPKWKKKKKNERAKLSVSF